MSVEIYELSDYQYETMRRLANDPSDLLVVITPVDEDTPEVKERFIKRKQDADDLVTLGLLEDRTSILTDAVIGFRLRAGRDPNLYYATEFGRMMFEGRRKKKIN